MDIPDWLPVRFFHPLFRFTSFRASCFATTSVAPGGGSQRWWHSFYERQLKPFFPLGLHLFLFLAAYMTRKLLLRVTMWKFPFFPLLTPGPTFPSEAEIARCALPCLLCLGLGKMTSFCVRALKCERTWQDGGWLRQISCDE